MRTALALAHRKNEMCESNMEQVVKDSRRKVHEANQAKLENDMRLRNVEHEVDNRRHMIKDMESEAIARLRTESSGQSSLELQVEYYKDLWTTTRDVNFELTSELSEARRSLKNSCNLSSAQLRVEDLENQVQIGALRVQDLTSEVSELTDANLKIKDEVTQASQVALSGSPGIPSQLSLDVTELRGELEAERKSQIMNKMLVKSELESERKLKLANSAHHFEQTSEWLSELQEMNEAIRLKTAEVNDREQISKMKQDKVNLLEQEVYMMKIKETSSPAMMDMNALSFSAGFPPFVNQTEDQVNHLKLELQQCHDENNVLRAWNRQLDDALTEEMNTASATNEKNEEKKAIEDGNDPLSIKDKDNCDPF